MSLNLNKVVLAGRMTADPELKQTASGTSVLSFTIAVNRRFVSKNNEQGENQADFINVVAWRQTADFVSKFFRKGSMIAVQGSLQSRSYEDKNGNKRVAYEVIADQVSFCGSKAESGTGSYDSVSPSSYNNSSADDFSSVVEDDDLPF